MMAYKNKIAAAIRVNNKILREHDGNVYIPYGSEYSVRIKNLNTVRALVNVYIDGVNATPDGLVLDAGREIDLERYVNNGNLSCGNKFKFIERTTNVEKHRGVKLEDGLVRVEFQFEHVYPVWTSTPIPTPQWYVDPYDYRRYGSAGAVPVSTQQYSNNVSYTSTAAAPTASNGPLRGVKGTSCHVGDACSDVGITVPGSLSTQKFTTVSNFPLEDEKHSIVFHLVGKLENNEPVYKPITTKHRPRCVTCGRQNKATSKFCVECGTALVIHA